MTKPVSPPIGLILGYGGTNAQQIHDGICKLKMCAQGHEPNRGAPNQ